MSGVSWIKIRTDIFSDEKIRLIEHLPEGDSILVIWVKLLTLAGTKNTNGEIFVNDEMAYTDEMLATIFNRKVNTVRLALKTFQKFRMIEIAEDQTIIISNWGKHQNLEGLDKIRQQNLERKKKQREKLKHDRLERKLLRDTEGHGSTATVREVSRDGHVTPRDSVTQDSVTKRDQKENKKENMKEKEISLSLALSESEEADLIQHAEAKRLFGKLSEDAFGEPLREAQWPRDLEDWLDQALPMKRDKWELIDWFYRLPKNHKIFTVTRRRQSMAALIENLRSESQKIRSARAAIGLKGLHDKPVEREDNADLTPEQVAAAKKMYGADISLPRKWSQLAPSVREEITAAIANQD